MPLCRCTRAQMDELLSLCTAYTSADLRTCEEALYMPEYDAWYRYVSDIDYGTFRAAGASAGVRCCSSPATASARARICTTGCSRCCAPTKASASSPSPRWAEHPFF